MTPSTDVTNSAASTGPDSAGITPTVVASLVEALLASDWPTTREDTADWFADHGLHPIDTQKMDSPVPGVHWVSQLEGEWAGVHFGWHEFNDEFVGLNWFLWGGGEPDDVLAKAQQLSDLLTAVHGEPEDVQNEPEGDFTRYWRAQPGHSIDMYAYSGRPSGERTQASNPVVQLHVDHWKRADAQEAEAIRLEFGDDPPTWKPVTN